MGSSKRAPSRGARQKKQKAGQGGKALLQRAYGLHQEGKFQEAHQAYESFLTKYPRHGEALGNFGLLLHSKGQCRRAVDLYERALALSPQLNHLYYFLGKGLHELGRPLDAISAYETALAGGHNKSDTLLQLGLAHVDSGQLVEARQCYLEILQDDPDYSPASYHLGLLFFEKEQFAEAVDCFAAVLACQPDHADTCFNLALCHKALGQIDLALEYLHQAAALQGQDADILYNIGVLYREQGELAEAEATFRKALEIDPANGICLTDLAILYHIQNRLNEAKIMYEKALATGYQADSAHHMLAALRGETTLAAPLQHVRDLFNNYARGFDASLVNDLHYSVPAQLALMLQNLRGNEIVSTAIDLGCGTGLSGLAFRGLAHHITGVDLAANMLALAAGKQLYDDLQCADIIDFLESCQTCYDLALATDVFVYLGGLEPFFQHLAPRLKPGGLLLFSVESCEQDYCLRQSGRYAHAAEYLQRLAHRFSFAVVDRKATGIRKERGTWIAGELYILQRL